jgi:hypothetical protein
LHAGLFVGASMFDDGIGGEAILLEAHSAYEAAHRDNHPV